MHPGEYNPHRSSLLLQKQVSVALLLCLCKLPTSCDVEAKNILLKALIFHLCR